MFGKLYKNLFSLIMTILLLPFSYLYTEQALYASDYRLDYHLYDLSMNQSLQSFPQSDLQDFKNITDFNKIEPSKKEQKSSLALFAWEFFIPGSAYFQLEEYSSAAFWFVFKSAAGAAIYFSYQNWQNKIDRFQSENLDPDRKESLRQDRDIASLYFTFAISAEVFLYAVSLLRLDQILSREEEKIIPRFDVHFHWREYRVADKGLYWYWQTNI